nr:hypothetical protein B0A51_15407 [Rachicladosporium sp. CCFEE 5018]
MEMVCERNTLQQLLTTLCESVLICNKNIELCTSEPCNNAPGHLDDAKTARRSLAGTIRKLDIALTEQDYGPYEKLLDSSEGSDKVLGGSDNNLPFMWSQSVSGDGSVDDLAEALTVAEMLCEQDNSDKSDRRASESPEASPDYVEFQDGSAEAGSLFRIQLWYRLQ